MWDMTHWYVWHDSFYPRGSLRSTTHSYVKLARDSFKCVTWLILTRDTWHVLYGLVCALLQNESCHTYKHIMSHKETAESCGVLCVLLQNTSCYRLKTSHITPMNKPCHARDKSSHTYEWVMATEWVMWHMWGWVISHIWISHVTHINTRGFRPCVVQLMCVIQAYFMTHSLVWYDSFTCVAWCMYIRDMNH